MAEYVARGARRDQGSARGALEVLKAELSLTNAQWTLRVVQRWSNDVDKHFTWSWGAGQLTSTMVLEMETVAGAAVGSALMRVTGVQQTLNFDQLSSVAPEERPVE